MKRRDFSSMRRTTRLLPTVLCVFVTAATLGALAVGTYLSIHRAGEITFLPEPERNKVLWGTTMTTKVNLEHSGPPLTLEIINAFEEEIRGRLPDDYKHFLLARNGGSCEPLLGLPWEERVERVCRFMKLLPTADQGIRRNLADLRELNCDGYLPVADTFNDQLICIAFRGDKSGAAYFTVYKYRALFRRDLVPIAVRMAPLADSFTEFLERLVEIPEPSCRIRDLGERGTPDDLAQYVAEGNSIDAVGRYDSTILCEAIKFANVPMIQACIERGASLSGTTETAVSCTHTELVKMLVDAGADVNERNEYGHTPLHYVPGTALPGEEGARNRQLRDLLIELGAIDPYRRIEELGERGTADDLGRYLAEGNSIDAVNQYDSTIVCEAIKANNVAMIQACIERRARLSGTIETAVENLRTRLIEMLVRAGADVNERNEFGHTPLEYVLVRTALEGEQGARNRELRDLLIELGAAR